MDGDKRGTWIECWPRRRKKLGNREGGEHLATRYEFTLLLPPWRLEWQGGTRGFLRLIFGRKQEGCLMNVVFETETGRTSREQLEIFLLMCRDVLRIR